MIVAEVIGRLREQAGAAFGLIEGAAELAALGNGHPTATPAAYVWIAEEAAGENALLNGVRQRLEIDLSVLVIAANVSDAAGGAASGDIESLKRVVRAALVGWQPPSAEDVITNVGAQIVRVRDGAVWCELTLATASYEGD